MAGFLQHDEVKHGFFLAHKAVSDWVAVCEATGALIALVVKFTSVVEAALLVATDVSALRSAAYPICA